MEGKKTIRIKDVAERAGVSTATVSHVINQTRFVSDDIQKKVIYVMEELDYRPNSAARSLRSSKTNTIGFLIPVTKDDISKSFFMTIAAGIEAKLKKQGYNLILSNSKEDPHQELEQIKLFNSRLIDGLILAPTNKNYHDIKTSINSNYPIVLIDRVPENYNGDFVLVDNYKGTYEGIENLILAKYKKIGFLSSTLGITTSDERFNAYKNAIIEHNFIYNESLVEIGESTFESGYQRTKLLLQKGIDSLFVANNVMTMGAIACLQEKGLKIPEDIAMIGYDNYDWTRITSPPLSVVKQPAFEVGLKAAESILTRIKKPDVKVNQVRLEPEVTIRGSY